MPLTKSVRKPGFGTTALGSTCFSSFYGQRQRDSLRSRRRAACSLLEGLRRESQAVACRVVPPLPLLSKAPHRARSSPTLLKYESTL
jgi:hypothetical protein